MRRKGTKLQKKPQTERSIKLDILRILSALGVVLLHISSDYIDILEVGSANFNAMVFLNSITRFAVPVFVMISGELFLNPDREVTVKKIWLHNILRIFLIYALWSYAYYVFQSLYFWKFDFYRQGLIRTLKGIVYASNHFWFLGMIIGLYALTPVLRSWVKNAEEKNIRYFLCIFFVFQILRTTFTLLINKSLIDEISGFFTVAEISGYVGYYVLGHYLSKYELSRNFKILVYAAFPVGLAANFIISALYSKKDGAYNPGIYDSFGVFTFFICIALFIFADKISKNIKKGKTIVSALAADTLGIYLIHLMLWKILEDQTSVVYAFNYVITALVSTVIVFAVSCVVSSLLRRIPYIGRYLV